MKFHYTLLLSIATLTGALYAQEDHLTTARTHANAAWQDTKQATSELGSALEHTAKAAGQAVRTGLAPVIETVRPAATKAENMMETAHTRTNEATMDYTSYPRTTPQVTQPVAPADRTLQRPLGTAIKEELRDVGQTVTEKASQLGHAVKETAIAVKDKAVQAYDATKEKTEDLLGSKERTKEVLEDETLEVEEYPTDMNSLEIYEE